MTQEINLLGARLRAQRRSLDSAAVLGPVLIVAAAAGLGAGVVLEQRTQSLREQHAANEERLQREQDQQRKLASEISQHTKNPALEAEAARIERRLAAVRQDLGALKDGAGGDVRGISEFMRALAHQGIDGVWVTGFSVGGAGDDISITGRALRADLVPSYLKRLGQDPYFAGRSFAALDIMPARHDARPESAASAPLAFSLMSRRERSAAAPGDGQHATGGSR